MALLAAREALSFPPGDNATDTFINNVHLNLTTLKHWNYTLYSNGSLSNTSWCLLTFDSYAPARLLPNGTFINATWCWSPTEPIGIRGGIGIGYAVLFGVALVMSLVCLNKHGSLHLPVEKRFYRIGRRWQWYWAIFVAATAIISLLVAVDVDRYFLPELPVILTSFFWYLMQWGAMALVWEAVRHWGSWMERQFIDPDPFTLRDGDRRSRVEFYLPLLFYLFLWLNFFMIVPRNWGAIELQRYPQQTVEQAAPGATDARFKAGAFLLVACWLVTGFSLRHSIKYYCPRNRGIFNRIIGFIRFAPLRFLILLPLAAALVAYQALVSFYFEYSPLRVGGPNYAIFPGGYTPSLLILFTQILFGFLNPNEDLELQRQRRVRNQAINREMGITIKPSWWRRVNGETLDTNGSTRDQLLRNVREIHGNKATGTASAAEVGHPTTDGNGPVEMTPVSPSSISSPGVRSPPLTPYTGRSEQRRQERAQQMAAGILFPEATQPNSPPASSTAQRRAELMMDGPPPPPYTETSRDRDPRGHTNGARSVGGQSETSTNQPPQQIRSMLDV
ncbi:hypothetical protein B0J18DRAFT_469544 [Chaetomium sp. MPI-SDFR-AT-0129]|nr:hypothetical protein B0J18DRAFT_469544 [Chaetomium sp. MPI-SDFR-AT-0129]